MELVIFDLDGTLIDSKRDLVCSVNAMRRHLGLPELPAELIFTYVGDGAPVLVRRALGAEASDSLAAEGLEFFLDYYHHHLLDHTVLYPGVRETLDTIREAGIPMAVLTNKPIHPTETIIEGLGLGAHFFRVYGGNSFERKKPDPAGVLRLLEESKAQPTRTVLAGDSAVDVRTARNAGIRSAGMTYGFQPQGLAAEPPDYLLDSIDQLLPVIFGQ
ncbi:MAG: Phosphoglycolate phosphatase [Bryobacteraceae bacterium]|nr:Phosphoglycolate phosphatase [Bryobacteraceae bacterium]